jgi:hypothetical protein
LIYDRLSLHKNKKKTKKSPSIQCLGAMLQTRASPPPSYAMLGSSTRFSSRGERVHNPEWITDATWGWEESLSQTKG